MKWTTIILILLITGCSNSPVNVVGELGNPSHSSEPVGIYLVPAWGVDPEMVRYLELKLADQHKARVVVTTEMGLDARHFDEEHRQFIGNEIIDSATNVAKRLRRNDRSIPLVVLIAGDLNAADFRYRFVFSLHDFSEKISVVSLARISPGNYGLDPDFDLTAVRALKLTNKALGYHLYGYKPSSDINNVMYGPIMGLEDLDRINSWYR